MTTSLHTLEKQLEDALVSFEQQEKYDLALQQYQAVEKGIQELLSDSEESHAVYALLAQCYLRQAGMLRQLGRLEEASEINQKEIECAKLSGNSIAYAQSLFSTGINHLSNRKIDEGLAILDEAKASFESEDSPEHKQGVGWYWIILADLGNKKMIKVSNEDIIQYASDAIEILTAINNKPGIARAYEARATAYQNLGEFEKAEADVLKSRSLSLHN